MTGIVPQVVVGLDLRQHLAAVAAGQVEVEQDEVGAGGVGVLALAAQVGERLAAVAHDVEAVVQVLLERLPGHQDVAGVVFHQQDVDDARFGGDHGAGSPGEQAT